MLPKKDGKQRGLPTKLGANVTAATDVGGTVVTSPRDATGAGAAAAAAAAAASHPPPPPAAEQLPKDSMRLSSLGDWLSKGTEAQLTGEEKGGVIPGIIAGYEDDGNDENDDELEALFNGSAPLSAVDQFDALSDSVESLLVSLVLCRRRTRFLCVQELDNSWYIPGGTVDAGESFQGAAMRCAMDEANVQIAIDGILRVEYSTSNGIRVRVVFRASPIDPTVMPKQEPDKHSLQAKWLSNLALKKFRLRTEQILDMFDWVDAECPAYPESILECPPFGPERSQIDHDQSITLLVHRAHLVIVDRRRRVFCLPDKSLPTMTLKEGQSFLRFPTIMANKYMMVLGIDAGNHPVEILHIWHAPPNPLDAVGLFSVTYVQKVRSDLPASANCITLDDIGSLKCAPAIRKRVRLYLESDGKLETMPLSCFVPEGTPYGNGTAQ